MTTAELRRKATRELSELSEPRLRAVLDIIAYLRDRESDEATEELLRIPGLVARVKKAEKEVTAGKSVNWRKVRRDV